MSLLSSLIVGIILLIAIIVIAVVVYNSITGAFERLTSVPGAISPIIHAQCYASDASFEACLGPSGDFRNGSTAQALVARSKEFGYNETQTSCLVGFLTCSDSSIASHASPCQGQAKYSNPSDRQKILTTCGVPRLPTVGVVGTATIF